MIRLTTIKSLLWFCAILLLVFSFPMQVYANNPYPSLLPYLLIGLIVMLSFFFPRKHCFSDINPRKNRSINFMVGIYLFLLLLNTEWQTLFGIINPYEGISALVIYLLPVVFYWYFRKIASEQEIRSVLLAIFVAGLIVGVYFVYDSYLKLGLDRVNDYAHKAFQYSIQRSNQTVEMANQMRISSSRSMGLLQHHSVSGAWVILGSFAALFFLPLKHRVFRRVVFFVFGMILLLGLNFTSIIVFSVTMFLFEFGGISLLRGRLSAKLVGSLV
ncbi:MAG TPA: hypothetical protein ENH82_07525, partial [bacterium]|nr:hypothetical protein [bacterium]